MTQLLKSWLSKGPTSQQLISFSHHDIVISSVFIRQVAHVHQQLISANAKSWLLASETSELFAVGLCAALLAGKEIILPANTQAGTLSEIDHSFEGVLCDLCVHEALVQQNLLAASSELTAGKHAILLKKGQPATDLPWPQCSQWGELTLYTSGSSGQPQAVHKTLAQLDAEVSILEHTFAEHLPQCSVISTVSHQHIYGLLFNILWPLAAGRPFLSNIVEYPETLTYYTSLFPNLCLVSSPAQLSRLPAALDNEPQLSSPCLVFSSGGPLSFDAAQGINHCYGQLPIEVFGSTETGGIAYRRQSQNDTRWQAFDNIRIRQDEADGALLLQSPYLTQDDWLRCEDKIQLLGEGKFQLLGRLDRIVKVEEKRVSLVQMEALLERHPFIAQAALVMLSQPRTQLGVVIELTELGKNSLNDTGKLNLNNLFKSHLLSQFERVTLPRRWRYPAQLPVNTQGKRTLALLIEQFDHD